MIIRIGELQYNSLQVKFAVGVAMLSKYKKGDYYESNVKFR